MWHSGLVVSLTMISIIAASAPAGSQAIVLNPDDVLPELARDTASATAFYINGLQTHGLNPAQNQGLYSAPAATKLMLSLLTLRMADGDALNLDAPVSMYLPDLIPADPFKAPITVRHLLQETAGFASPPLSLTINQLEAPLSIESLAPFTINMRGPGQASSHDPVGWAILIALLEHVSSAPISQLVEDQIAQPLGIADDSFDVHHQSLGGTGMPLVAKMSLSAFAQIVRPLIRNRDYKDQPFLNRDSHAALVSKANSFRLHPFGRSASLGTSIESKSGFGMVTGLNATCYAPLAFAAFPTQGVAFIAAVSTGGKTDECAPHIAHATGLEQAEKHFPRSSATPAPTPKLARPSKLEGRYISADRSPAELSERLGIMQSDWLTLGSDGKDGLLVMQQDGSLITYREASPYAYAAISENTLGPELLFSPYRLGGYLVAANGVGIEKLYRRVDILGRTGPLFDLMPMALLLIASASIYTFRPPNKQWRNMGLFAFTGATLVGVGLYFEINSWASVLYEQKQPMLIILWRTSLNIGLMLLLALPMFVFSFTRNKVTSSGTVRLIVVPHLALITAAALTVFLTLIMWGLAGTFAPY